MDAASLLRELNKRAALADLGAVTLRRLYDWCEEELLVGPTRHGQGRGRPLAWRWSEEDLETATKLVELKATGLRRANELAIMLWLEERPIPAERFKAALRSEFDRWLRLRRRELRPPRDGERAASQKALLARLGALDAGFNELRLALDPGLLLSAFQACLGEADTKGSDGVSTPSILETLILGMAGFLGLPDEVEASGHSAIAAATETDLLTARDHVMTVEAMATLGYFAAANLKNVEQNHDFDRLPRSLRQLHWRLPMFVQILNGIVNGGSNYGTGTGRSGLGAP